VHRTVIFVANSKRNNQYCGAMHLHQLLVFRIPINELHSQGQSQARTRATTRVCPCGLCRGKPLWLPFIEKLNNSFLFFISRFCELVPTNIIGAIHLAQRPKLTTLTTKKTNSNSSNNQKHTPYLHTILQICPQMLGVQDLANTRRGLFRSKKSP
jgi:hypothetical protein